MSKQTINIGTVANDGTGDTIRSAMTKTNSNFSELYDKISPITDSLDSALSLLYCDTDGNIAPISGIKFNPASGELRFDSVGTPDGSTITITDNNNTNFYMVEYGDSSTTYPSISLSKRRGNISNQLDCQPGDIVGSYSAFGGVSGSVYSVGNVEWLATTPTNGKNNSIFYLKTRVAGSIGTRLAIDESGSVVLYGNLKFQDSTVQTSAAISIADLKTLVAASTDFADFQARIAAL